MRGRLTFWLVVLAGWTVLVVVFAVSSSLTYALSYQPPRWRYTLTMAATEWYVWAAFTPVVAWLARRFRMSRRQWWRALILAAAGLPAAFFKVTFTRILRGPIGADEYFQITTLVGQYLIYWAIIVVTHAWLYYRESQQRALQTSQLEALLAETRLQMLRMQLQPHFLFNTLNTIAELVHERPDAAERMIAGLSHLLRETLHAGLVDRVPLKQELELLGRYVDIQRARFGERLEVRVTVHDGAEAALVPSLLLQPLVENAIRHGIGARAGAGHIDVDAARDSASLRITVADDGRGLPAGAPREGLGLANSRERLRTLYGDTATLAVEPRLEGGVMVRLSMPWETAA
ncbi:MAG TPA: histidine kinase [Vicinamibacterales bacterium]|nr:histidine kinase [Vicinamibacterales bacterium]